MKLWLVPILTPLAELDVSAALRQLSEQRRDEDLAALCLIRNARGEVHALAVEVPRLLDHLAGVEPDPHPHP